MSDRNLSTALSPVIGSTVFLLEKNSISVTCVNLEVAINAPFGLNFILGKNSSFPLLNSLSFFLIHEKKGKQTLNY